VPAVARLVKDDLQVTPLEARWTIPASSTMQDAWNHMLTHNLPATLIYDQDHCLGLITEDTCTRIRA